MATGGSHSAAAAMAGPPGRIVLSDLFGPAAAHQGRPFVPFVPGVEIMPLYGMDAAGKAERTDRPAAALLRYAPGASVPTHLHRGHEHIVVLHGSQSDEWATYGVGSCVINPPGTRHAVASEDGCVVLAIWHRPVQIEAATEPAAGGAGSKEASDHG